MGRYIVPILGLIWACGVGARPSPEISLMLTEEEPTLIVAQRGPVSLSQAQQMAVQRFPGRVVRAETVAGVHQVRILGADGRVRNVRIDARTGAFL